MVDFNEECEDKRLTDRDAFYRDCVVFWSVDTQKDFMNPKGKLYVTDSAEIKPKIKEITEYANEKGIPILGSMDLHGACDPELKPIGDFEPHCMAITRGPNRCMPSRGAMPIPQSIIDRPLNIIRTPDGFDKYYTDCLKVDGRLCGGLVAKDTYSVFDKKDVMDRISDRLQGKVVVIYGVATDYCVQAAANGFLNEGIKPIILKDAVKGIDDEASTWHLDNLEDRGASVVRFAELDGILGE